MTNDQSRPRGDLPAGRQVTQSGRHTRDPPARTGAVSRWTSDAWAALEPPITIIST